MLQGSKVIVEELEAINNLCTDRTVDFQLLCLESAEWIRDFVNANIDDNHPLEIEPHVLSDIYNSIPAAVSVELNADALVDKPLKTSTVSENGSDTDLGVMGDTESIDSTCPPTGEPLPMEVINEVEEDGIKQQLSTIHTVPEATLTQTQPGETQSPAPLKLKIDSSQQTFADAETSHYDLLDSQQPGALQKMDMGMQVNKASNMPTQETFIEETRYDIEMTQVTQPSQHESLQQPIDLSNKVGDSSLPEAVPVTSFPTENMQVEEKHIDIPRVTFAALPPREPINTKRSIVSVSGQSERTSFAESLRIEAAKRKTLETKKSLDEIITKNAENAAEILDNSSEPGKSQFTSKHTTRESKAPNTLQDESVLDITARSSNPSVYFSPKSTQRSLKSPPHTLNSESVSMAKGSPKYSTHSSPFQKVLSPSKVIDEERQVKEKHLKDKFASAGIQLHEKINQMTVYNKNPGKSNIQKDEPSLGHFTSDDGDWIPKRDYTANVVPTLTSTAEGPTLLSPLKSQTSQSFIVAASKSEIHRGKSENQQVLTVTAKPETRTPARQEAALSPAKLKSATKIPSLPQLRTPAKDSALKTAALSVPRPNFEAPKQVKTQSSPSRMAAAFNAAKARAAEGLRKAKELLIDPRDEQYAGGSDAKIDRLYPHVNTTEKAELKKDDVFASNNLICPSQEAIEVGITTNGTKPTQISPKRVPQSARVNPSREKHVSVNEIRKSPRKLESIQKTERSQEASSFTPASKMATRMASRQAAAQKTKTIMRVATASQREMERKNTAAPSICASSQTSTKRGSSEEPNRPESAASNDRPGTFKAGNKVIKSLNAASNAKKKEQAQRERKAEQKKVLEVKRLQKIDERKKPVPSPKKEVSGQKTVSKMPSKPHLHGESNEEKPVIALKRNFPLESPMKELKRQPSTVHGNRFIQQDAKRRKTQDIIEQIPLPPQVDNNSFPKKASISGKPMRTSGLQKHDTSKMPYFNKVPNTSKFRVPGPKMPPVEGITYSTETIRFAGETQQLPPSENIELPEIDSDDSDDEPKEKPILPAWATSPELRAALRQQQKRDPDEIFGPIGPLQMDEIFKHKNQGAKFRARSSSANWSGQDKLTPQEMEEYALKMGYR